MGESDDNDTRIANGYNSHSVTSNNESALQNVHVSVAPEDIQFDAVSIQAIKHQIDAYVIRSIDARRIESTFACVRETFDSRRGCDTKCGSELTLEVSHELIIRIARATPGHRWKKGCFNRSTSIVEEELQ